MNDNKYTMSLEPRKYGYEIANTYGKTYREGAYG